MPKSIYINFLIEQPNASIHYLNRLVKFLNHFILIEPTDKPKDTEKSAAHIKIIECLEIDTHFEFSPCFVH